jgi:hypothetical protein
MRQCVIEPDKYPSHRAILPLRFINHFALQFDQILQGLVFVVFNIKKSLLSRMAYV